MSALVLILYLLVLSAEYALEILNLNHLRRHGHEVPPEFEGEIDPEILKRTSAYTLEHARVGFVSSAARNLILLLFLFAGWIGVYDRWIDSLSSSFLIAGLLFFLGLVLLSTLLGLPFDLYRTFSIEERYGFNRKTKTLWLADFVKSLLLSLVLLSVLLAGALLLLEWSPGGWWLWVWGFFLAFQLAVMFIAPYLLGALFFKFEPLRVEGLEEKIKTLAEGAGFKVSGVFQIDASKRTAHSNAFFIGLGRTKRVALFDTLLEQITPEEVLAILAHEVGHWKKRHLLKRFLLSAAVSLAGLFLAFQLIRWGNLPALIGLDQGSVYVQLVILGFLLSIVSFPLTPVSSFLSRRDEREADRFASVLTGNPGALASGLVKLSRQNLSNLHPHPLYAKFHYSHPPDVERVRALTKATLTTEPQRTQR